MSQDKPIFPEQTRDDDPDTYRRGSGDDEYGDGHGSGGSHGGSHGGYDPDDERILRERPPHW